MLPFLRVTRQPKLPPGGPLAWLAAGGKVKVQADALALSSLCDKVHLVLLARISEIRLVPRLGCAPPQLHLVVPARAGDPRQVYSIAFKGASDARTIFDMLSEQMHYGDRSGRQRPALGTPS